MVSHKKHLNFASREHPNSASRAHSRHCTWRSLNLFFHCDAEKQSFGRLRLQPQHTCFAPASRCSPVHTTQRLKGPGARARCKKFWPKGPGRSLTKSSPFFTAAQRPHCSFMCFSILSSFECLVFCFVSKHLAASSDSGTCPCKTFKSNVGNGCSPCWNSLGENGRTMTTPSASTARERAM